MTAIADMKNKGFTLIELSIVLVIIGLIIGGVLVGQDLIRAAETRAQITQIEKYNSAVNTFRSKFNAIPGDMRPEIAQQFGFTVGSGCAGSFGRRDGNGLLDGNGNVLYYLDQGIGEVQLFWSDISSPAGGNLIEGAYQISSNPCGTAPGVSGTSVGSYLPAAAIGHGDYIYVYEYSGANWFAVSGVTSLPAGGNIMSNANIPVMQAYKIDSKIDDGIPATGNVQAAYINNGNGSTLAIPSSTATSGGTATSCLDTTTGTYSVTANNGNGGNCALSVKFQ